MARKPAAQKTTETPQEVTSAVTAPAPAPKPSGPVTDRIGDIIRVTH